MSEDLGMLLVRETWQLSTLLRRFHGTRVWEESKSLIVVRVLEMDDRFFWQMIGGIKEDKGEGCLPMQELLFHSCWVRSDLRGQRLPFSSLLVKGSGESLR